MIKGNTFISVGDPLNPDYRKDLGNNDSIPYGESKVIASFARGVHTVPYKYLAIGGGNTMDFKDPLNPPTNEYIITKHFSSIGDNEPHLFSEFYRVEFIRSSFLDDSNNYTQELTNKIELIWSIPNDGAIGVWRELGIFSGNATEVPNSGVLVHYQTIKDDVKTLSSFGSSDLNFHWRIEF